MVWSYASLSGNAPVRSRLFHKYLKAFDFEAPEAEVNLKWTSFGQDGWSFKYSNWTLFEFSSKAMVTK